MEDFYFEDVKDGVTIYYSPVCESTGAVAKICRNNLPGNNPICAYTFHQTLGRGQGSNTWESQPGKNLAVTFIFSLHKADSMILYNKAIALGVKKCIETFSSKDVRIKWPNDIFLQGKKISGLLLESWLEKNDQRLLSIGIGINVNQQKWQGDFNATSLFLVENKENMLHEVLLQLIECINLYINSIKKNKIIVIEEEFNHSLALLQQNVQLLKSNGDTLQGTLMGVDSDGKIMVQLDGGIAQSFHHGEVRIKK